MSQQTCSCADRNCFHGGCACFTNEGVCSKDCKCRAKCKNILGNEKTITKQFAEYNQAAAAQPASDQAAAQPQPKPLPELEPGSARQPCHCASSKCQNFYCRCVRANLPCFERCDCKDCGNTKTHEEKLQDLGIKVEDLASGSTVMTRGKAQAAKESAVGCKCQTECASRCGCVRRNIKCTSKCKCQVCGNDDGSRFPANKCKAGSGGQGGTRSSSRAVEPAGKRPKHG
ncbi:CRC domain-containing protein TSO1-like isoform X1 [Triticum dicoccoides]|uniref:CRC domain-containing protein TSO1-like isoform X1 n=1 Tax=Triticum dicoccoides TaxID=85692 RepID=UPI00189083D6|nr:CRC domain-containing protein TSO1-like isoform X1 [Triticum dicoccoides]